MDAHAHPRVRSVLLVLMPLLVLLMLILVISHISHISHTPSSSPAVEEFSGPKYLSVVHVTSKQLPLAVCVPRDLAPCEKSIKALTSIQSPLTPRVQTESNQECDLTCSDVVSAWMLNTNSERDYVVAACPHNDLVLTVIACLGHGRLPRMIKNSSGLDLHDIAEAGGTVSCAGPLEQRLLTDICSCVDLNIPTTLLANSVDAGLDTVAYMRPVGHPDVIAALIRPNAVTVNIPRIDASLFALRQPLAKLTGTTVTSTCVLLGRASLSGDLRVRAVVRALTELDATWAGSELNYASKYLNLLESTRELLRPIDAVAKSRLGSEALTDDRYAISTVSILQEGFRETKGTPSITLVTYDPVEAYMTSTTREDRCRVLEMRSEYIGASRMRVGDRVILRSQVISKHNGEYMVQALRAVGRGTVLVSWSEATYDALTFTDVQAKRLADGGNPAAVTMRATKHGLRDPKRGNLWPGTSQLQVGDLLLLRNLHTTDGGTGVWTAVTDVQGATVTMETTTPPHTAASDGSCVTSPMTEIKSVCEAEGGLWDAPCISDDQCPYFQKNKRYPNYRGGCLESGWCEMPLGVVQQSFRTAIGEPACHGQGRGPDCVDIAFPLDEYERSLFSSADLASLSHLPVNNGHQSTSPTM